MRILPEGKRSLAYTVSEDTEVAIVPLAVSPGLPNARPPYAEIWLRKALRHSPYFPPT